MNELIKPEFDVLMDNVPIDQRPEVARLMEQVEAYEDGDFGAALDYLDMFTAIKRHADEGFIRTLTALLRIVRYCNELMRAKLSDSTPKETET